MEKKTLSPYEIGMRKGELERLWNFYRCKRLYLTVTNNIDKRMYTKFLSSKWNYYPKKCDKNWIKENYIKDSTLTNRIGVKTRLELTLEEWAEVKGFYMIRNYIWRRFHTYNKNFNNRWKIKYGANTEFEVHLVDW